jgi:hypothetical protein
MPIELKDKITIWISIVALLVSIATPIATYYWLDPKLKELKDQRGLVYLLKDYSEHWKLRKAKSDPFSDFYQIQYTVQLKNTGALPAKNVVLSLVPRLTPKTVVSFSSHAIYDRRDSSDSSYITLKQPIKAGRTVGPRDWLRWA